MTATDELRKLLDERGVEHYDGTETICWRVNENGSYDCYASEQESGKLYVNIHHATPEQAIAATLGRGTCKNIAPRYLDFLCSECGFVHYIDDVNCTGDGNEWEYCPKCGCEVER